MLYRISYKNAPWNNRRLSTEISVNRIPTKLHFFKLYCSNQKITVKVKVKVKFTLEQATEAQRGSRDIARAVFTHGPKGPEPRAANFQGRHIKKNRV
jgi:hypothetical protein